MITGTTPEDRRAFILANTRLQHPPHTPELVLHLADEITPIWRMTEEALAEIGLPPPFWAFAWAGGQAIARYLLDHPAEVAGKRVLDFATGSGLCAIAALKVGAADAQGADIDPFAEAAVALNAEANGVRVAFTGDDLLAADPPTAAVILAGDICYEQPLASRALAWLHTAHTRGARVLIGQIYMPYTRGQTPRIVGVYTPELQRAIDRQDDGDGTGLGYDPFCRCQDFENFRYTIQSVERRDNGGATARISIFNMNEHRIVTLLLDHRGDRWQVADIREGQESLLAAGRR